MVSKLFVLIVLISFAATFAVQSFLAPPQTTGSITVKLCPTETVATGSPKLVTFGVPFTRGSVTIADLARVRVLQGATEIPAYVAQLTPWRSLNDADTSWVRIARIQINYTFTAAYPNSESITVEWGRNNRAQNIAVFTNPRTAWHAVTSGSFVAADGISEPDIYAVLPKDFLCQGVLKLTRMNPMMSGVPEARENPATVKNKTGWQQYEVQDHLSIDQFYTIINEDMPTEADSDKCLYKDSISQYLPADNCNNNTPFECWLFDRSSAMFITYIRSGYFKMLREGVRAAEYYGKFINSGGFFMLKPQSCDPDPKYSYAECLAYGYWLTGDDSLRAKIPLVPTAFTGVATHWTPTMNFWTERHSGFKLLANIIAWEVTGTASFKTMAQTIVSDFIWHQNGAGGQIPGNRIDGALYHYGFQHSSDWPDNSLGASPWMTSFVFDPMIRVYALSADTAVGAFIRRVGNFEVSASRFKTLDHPGSNAGVLYQPAYAMLADGTLEGDYSDIFHALDVSGILGWSHYFSEGMGKPDTLYRHWSDTLYTSYAGVTICFIQPGGSGDDGHGPEFWENPYRKYAWEYRNCGGLSWAAHQTGAWAPVGTIGKPVAAHYNSRTSAMVKNTTVFDLQGRLLSRSICPESLKRNGVLIVSKGKHCQGPTVIFHYDNR